MHLWCASRKESYCCGNLWEPVMGAGPVVFGTPGKGLPLPYAFVELSMWPDTMSKSSAWRTAQTVWHLGAFGVMLTELFGFLKWHFVFIVHNLSSHAISRNQWGCCASLCLYMMKEKSERCLYGSIIKRLMEAVTISRLLMFCCFTKTSTQLTRCSSSSFLATFSV